MRRDIVFDTAEDSRNTHFEKRCLLLLLPLSCDGKPPSRSNLVTLRFTLVVMAEEGDRQREGERRGKSSALEM